MNRWASPGRESAGLRQDRIGELRQDPGVASRSGGQGRMSVARRPLRVLLTAAAVGAATLSVVPPASASPGRGQAQAPAAWRASFTVSGPHRPYFSAVTAISGRMAWAFSSAVGKAPAAFKLTGSGWTRRAFPAQRDDVVTAASASSASNVWAFTVKGQVLRFNGSRWSKVTKFSREIRSGLALSKTDVWVFGSPGAGTWHFNGRHWTKFASGRGLEGASALSARSIWAYGGTSVAHWNGHSWIASSLARLLPRNTQHSHSFLAGIYAASASSVYVAASGGRVGENGPLILLHFNGSAWHRVAFSKSLGGPAALISDGRGGLWIPVNTGFPGNGSMEHFSKGVLSSVRLPFSPPHLTFFGAAIGQHTTAALAVGYTRTSLNAPTTTAVILRYGA